MARRTLTRKLRVAMFAGSCAALVALAIAPLTAGTFGTRCQRTWQNNWKPSLMVYQYVRCEGFNNELDDTDTKKFYFDLNGGSGFTFNDGFSASGGVDSVDLFYVSTHGGAWDNPLQAVLALFAEDSYAVSTQWRFGDNSRAVKIVSQYACATLKPQNGWARWASAFKGGLYIATGSHDKLVNSVTTAETGEDYADDLQHGKSIKWAWFDGNSDWYSDQDVAVFASSSGPLIECQIRRDFMSWQNVASLFPRLRDANMNRICASWIDNN